MAKLIANERVYMGWFPGFDAFADYTQPTAAELTSGVDYTCWLISVNASAQGNSVPTPDLCSLFETTVPSTASATFTADFYKDDEDDTPWENLVRSSQGYFVLERMKPVGADPLETGALVEVWPVYVISRAAGPLTSSQVQMFTLNCSVPKVPVEDYSVPAGP